MHPQVSSASSSAPSGIPRASRLPVLNRRSSQVLPSKQDGSKPPTPSLSRSTSSSTILKQSPAPSTSAVPPTTKATTTLRTPSSIASRPRIPPRPSSRANQQRRPPSPRKPVATAEDEENHDQLGSLDSFRSASRQDCHDDSPPEASELLPFSPQPGDRKSSRPSLSDRTIESLQNVPTTPKDRRRSSFFSPAESPMGPPPRPTSSMSRAASDRSSRPGTSDGSFASAVGRAASSTEPTALGAKPAKRTSLGGFGFTPRTNSRLPSVSKPFSTTDPLPEPPRSPSPSKRATTATRPNGAAFHKATGSKTVAGRTYKPRPALTDALPPAAQSGSVKYETTMRDAQEHASQPSASSKRAVSNPSNSSAALRQQIAAAKAAARKERAKHDSPQALRTGSANALEIELSTDPFHQAPRDDKHILRNRINAAQMDGRLNIAALNLKEIPEAVMKMYDAAAMEESKVNWAEVVDLTRLNAADNEIEEIDDNVFPDASGDDFAEDDDTSGNQFGGLEILDLHGNRLHALPLGLRRLERLTTLNLSHNKLENAALNVVSQISSLRSLRFGHNALSGNLPASLCTLEHLETLDLQANRLLGLPDAVRDLVALRVLNVSGNQLTSLPMDGLQGLKLSELDASSNALIGPLFPMGTTSAHAMLQTLNVSNNSLAALTFDESLDLPQLRNLDVANNHLTGLPSVSGWTELITLMAGDNKMTEIPAGFASLRNLRNVNFSSNGIRRIDPEIGRMQSLEGFVLASNPLRDKKFLTMNAHDIKRDLRARLEPIDVMVEDEMVVGEAGSPVDPVVPSVSSSTTAWTLTSTNLLDLSNISFSDSINNSLGSFLQSHTVKHLDLSMNKLSAIPPALCLGQDLRVLDLSGNSLGSDYLSDKLELPMLQELRVARCSVTTLEPLLTQLQAPRLRMLDVTANRLAGPVPALRATYPALTTFFAGDNKFSSVTVQALRGLQTVNLQCNNLEQLPAEIGLLWHEGLKSLEVGSNAFRMPNYRVLEKGTEALMTWLRNRVPGAEEGGDG